MILKCPNYQLQFYNLTCEWMLGIIDNEIEDLCHMQKIHYVRTFYYKDYINFKREMKNLYKSFLGLKLSFRLLKQNIDYKANEEEIDHINFKIKQLENLFKLSINFTKIFNYYRYGR